MLFPDLIQLWKDLPIVQLNVAKVQQRLDRPSWAIKNSNNRLITYRLSGDRQCLDTSGTTECALDKYCLSSVSLQSSDVVVPNRNNCRAVKTFDVARFLTYSTASLLLHLKQFRYDFRP